MKIEQHLAVVGIVTYREGAVVVRQQGPADQEPVWSPPGGRVEPGETFSAAAVREILEETGLQVGTPQRLVYTSQQRLILEDRVELWTALGLGFDLSSPPTFDVRDPDGLVDLARLVPFDEATSLVSARAIPSVALPFQDFCQAQGAHARVYEFEADLRGEKPTQQHVRVV